MENNLDLKESIPLGNHILRIKDTFHGWIDPNTWVYSNDPCFEGDINEFFRWVNQHGGDYNDIQVLIKEN